MKYISELNSVKEFGFWSGAQQTADAINENEKADEIWDALDNLFDEGEPMTETEINDFVWFEADEYIKETLGISIYGED